MRRSHHLPELLNANSGEVERVIVIPTEPGDVVSHSDGDVRFIGSDVVPVNDYRKVGARTGLP